MLVSKKQFKRETDYIQATCRRHVVQIESLECRVLTLEKQLKEPEDKPAGEWASLFNIPWATPVVETPGERLKRLDKVCKALRDDIDLILKTLKLCKRHDSARTYLTKCKKATK